MANKVMLLLVVLIACSLFANGQSDDQEQRLSRLFFGAPGLGNFGDLSAVTGMFNCRPFNRTFVQTGVPCMQANMTALSCRNETCVCNSISFPSSGMPGFPSPPIEMPMSFSLWNCTASGSGGSGNPGFGGTGSTGR